MGKNNSIINALWQFSKKIAPIGLVCCFIIYSFLSWILLLRDGKGIYGILSFYPQFVPFIKTIEPHLVKYGINSIPTLVFIAISTITIIFYCQSLWTKISLKKTVLFALVFQGIIFFSYPSLATDIFSYIVSDRITTIHHENVWLTKPNAFPNDPFFKMSDWEFQTRVYGGVNQFFYNFASYAGGSDLLKTVVAYKVLVWLFTIGSMYVIYLLAKKYYPQKEAVILRLIFWNPLVVLEMLGSGHNDILMIFFMLLSFYFFVEKKWLLAGLAIAAAVQVKIIAILLFGFIAFSLLIHKKVSPFFLFSGIFLLFNTLCFYFMQITPLVFIQNISFNVGVYWQSLPLLVHKVFPQEKLIFSLGFILTVIGLLWYQWKKNNDPLTIYAFGMFFYLLFFTSAHWNWYILWIFPFVPFISSKPLKNAVIIFTFTALLSYPIFWLSLRFYNEFILWHIFRYLFLCGIPLGVYIYCLRHKNLSFFPFEK